MTYIEDRLSILRNEWPKIDWQNEVDEDLDNTAFFGKIGDHHITITHYHNAWSKAHYPGFDQEDCFGFLIQRTFNNKVQFFHHTDDFYEALVAFDRFWNELMGLNL